MSRRSVLRGLRSTARAGSSAAVLAGLVIGTIGFPIRPPGSGGGAFPCQGHGCGCGTAEECWGNCCCLTPKQRLAWAERNGVTPPAELVRLVRAEKPVAKRVASCCSGEGRHCREGGSKAYCDGKSETAVAKRSKDHSGAEVAKGHCRGLGRWWVAAGQPLALPERPMTLAEAGGSEPVILSSPAYSLDGDAPPTRPG